MSLKIATMLFFFLLREGGAEEGYWFKICRVWWEAMQGVACFPLWVWQGLGFLFLFVCLFLCFVFGRGVKELQLQWWWRLRLTELEVDPEPAWAIMSPYGSEGTY